MMIARRRRLVRRLAVAVAAMMALLLAVSAVSYKVPWGLGLGRMGIGADQCGLVLARSTHQLSRNGVSWRLGTAGSLPLGAETDWLPVRARGRIITSSPTGPSTTALLDVLYIPLGPWAALAGMVTGGLWWYSRRKVPAGRCRDCAYDVRGIAAERCPECGGWLRDLAALVVKLWGRPITGARLDDLAAHHLSQI